MRRGGERCDRSEAASSRGRNEAARGAAKVKRRGAPRGGERCGELAAGRTVRREASGAVQAKPRSGTGHAPLPRRPSERPILAALPPLAPAAALFPPHSPPHFPAAAPPPLTPSPSPAAAPAWARRQGKSQTRRAAFRGAAAPARPLGARRLPWDGWLPLGARARASSGGARGAAKGDKMPLLSRIRAKIRRKILQFSPPCAILNIPRNSIDNVTRYKRAFLYLFFPCDFIYAKE